jgi:hypothetical protein
VLAGKESPLIGLLAILGNGKEGFNLNHDIILKPGREFVKEAYHALEFFFRGFIKHIALAGFEPGFRDAEGKGNEMDNPVVDRFMPTFKLSDITIADEYTFGKFSLGKFEGFPGLANPVIDGHRINYSGKKLTKQGV